MKLEKANENKKEFKLKLNKIMRGRYKSKERETALITLVKLNSFMVILQLYPRLNID